MRFSGAIFPRHLDKNNARASRGVALYVWHLSPQQWKFVNYSCDMHPESGGGVKLMRTPSCINTMGLKEEVVMDDVWSSCR
jgi:hypothetical protein